MKGISWLKTNKTIFSSRAWWRRASQLWDGLFAYFDGGWRAVRRSLKLLPMKYRAVDRVELIRRVNELESLIRR